MKLLMLLLLFLLKKLYHIPTSQPKKVQPSTQPTPGATKPSTSGSTCKGGPFKVKRPRQSTEDTEKTLEEAATVQLIETLSRQQEESAQLQSHISSLVKDSPAPSSRQLWGSWIGSMAAEMDERVVGRFYRRTLDAALDAMEETRRLRDTRQQPVFFQAPLQPVDSTTYQNLQTVVPQQQQQQQQQPIQHQQQQLFQPQQDQGQWQPSGPSTSALDWSTAGPGPSAGQNIAQPVRPQSSPADVTSYRLSDISLSQLTSPAGPGFNTSLDNNNTQRQ